MGDYGDAFQRIVAKELQGERAIAALSYEALGERAGVNTQTVMRYLTGKRDIPMPVFLELCRAMDVEPGEIMSRAERRLEKG